MRVGAGYVEGVDRVHAAVDRVHAPGVVVRGGTSSEGLPIGVQVVAAPTREDIALAVASRIEMRLGGFRPPPR